MESAEGSSQDQFQTSLLQANTCILRKTIECSTVLSLNNAHYTYLHRSVQANNRNHEHWLVKLWNEQWSRNATKIVWTQFGGIPKPVCKTVNNYNHKIYSFVLQNTCLYKFNNILIQFIIYLNLTFNMNFIQSLIKSNRNLNWMSMVKEPKYVCAHSHLESTSS